MNHLLSLLIFLPTVGALVTLLAKGRNNVRWVALGTTIITFLVSLLLFATYHWRQGSGYSYADSSGGGGVVQMVESANWIPAFNIQYKVGIDGLSFPLVILSTFICLLSCIASWNIEKMLKGYMVLFLLLETGILGVFLSLDFFLFYVFFEVSLLPMYFLIGIWCGPRKEYAAIKFFLYTLLGSIGLLIVLIGTYLYSKHIPGGPTLDLIRLASPEARHAMGAAGVTLGLAKVLFILAMVAFLIKVPAVLVHTWLPDAHVEVPKLISLNLPAT